ncbi:M20 family metallopeptidase [Mycolicibacterium tokaiense]|uniref:Acetylornithine deacetylase or succinyl-diaminopimelate desuccinylase n=1 Tax=Mycolicibacterium tokaiense TaxID=39695 RepID=A0A378TE98_9MYCO|nr:M20/M25/M40 family metallo-hydrolase [Mycolicibacterium tokaiense]BBY87315.1 acetylornithine deacetylase [Mycolicibacterium tokaiense]STZ58173.1 acetylornithine deacetylase or succinyl-diaminopimelate desuccinylase [Mycolicibacterium tokaiense]
MIAESEEQTLAIIDEHIDIDRLVTTVQAICRIPSVLGDEGAFAAYLVDMMHASGFDGAALQPVLPDRPNATGHLDFGTGGRTVVLTGHLDTKPPSHGWTVTEPFSGALIDGSIYGQGIMDMKAALVCQVIAMEALRASKIPLNGRLAFAGVADHMGDQLGAIEYFAHHPADLAVLGECSGSQIYLGHRGRYYFDITVRGLSAHTCHKPAAINANLLAAHAIIELDASKLEPQLEEWVLDLFGPETFMAPGRVYGGLPPGGPSMIPDECVIRVDCRPQPGVTIEEVRAEIDRCLAAAAMRDPRFKADVELVDVKDGYLVSRDDEVATTMIRALASVRGHQSPVSVGNWLGDTSSVGHKVPTIIFGPGAESAYAANEHLTVDEIVEATRAYAVFAALSLGAGA